MIWEFTYTQRQFQWLLRSYLIGCSISLALLFAAYATGIKLGASDDTRYTGGAMNVNSLARIIDIGITIAVYLASQSTSKSRLLYWLFVPPACLGVLLTGSRVGAIALAAAIGIGFLIAAAQVKRSLILLGLGTIIAAWLVPSIIPAALRDRVMEGREASTFELRQQIWKAGLECWAEAPIIGVGASGFVTAVSANRSRALVAHNTFVQILVDNGIVGIGLMLGVWGILAGMAWRLPRNERILSLGVFAIWVIASMGGSLEYAKDTWLIYAWIMVQSQLVRESRMLEQHQAFVRNGCSQSRSGRREVTNAVSQ